MTLPSRAWEDRYRRLAQAQPEEPHGVASIPVSDLRAGDHVMWGGRPFEVRDVELDGPIVIVQCVAPAGRLDFMSIERVNVRYPRPEVGS